MQRYTTISLFSGAMGLDAGLETTGRFRILAALEKEPSFCASIRANRDGGLLERDMKVFEGPIADFDPLKMLEAVGLRPGELDLLVGGPPCQSFSTAGRRGTTQDARGTLIWDFLRFVEIMQPKFFLMENVRGLLSAALRHRPIANRPDKSGVALDEDEQPGSVVRAFADDLKATGLNYHMDCFEVNAVNYGAPQLRERAFFVGNRYNSQVEFPSPTHGGPEQEPGDSDLFGGRDPLAPWATLRDAIGDIDDPGDVVMDFSPRKKFYLAKVPEGSNWRSLPVEDQKISMGKAWLAKGGRSGWWRRLSFDLPCPTLVTMPNHASTALCHPADVRALSLKEYAAIQEFPRGWVFCGTTGQQYAQVGNAVPVRLGKVAGGVIAQALDALAANAWQPLNAPPSHYRIVYVQSHVRTRRWFKGGKTIVWNDGGANEDSGYRSPVTVRDERRMAV